MIIQLSIYTKKAFHEYLLPPINNANYAIVLNKAYFSLVEDIRLKFEIYKGSWRILHAPDYYLSVSDSNKTPIEIVNGTTLRINSVNNEEILLIAIEQSELLLPYTKYEIKNIHKINIGKNKSNEISFNNNDMVSELHTVLIQDSHQWRIENRSGYGLYVNDSLVEAMEYLQFGDYINILGLHLVFLGDILAIDTRLNGVSIRLTVLSAKEASMCQTATTILSDNSKIRFHRSPRHIEKLYHNTIRIEEPPVPQTEISQSLLETVGLAFTMALPILLGCVMIVYSPKTSETSFEMFKYFSLLMAFSSVGIGIIWVIVNIRYHKKKKDEIETKRISAYNNYLLEKTEQIKKEYQENKKALEANYPSAIVCSSFGSQTASLWNRNETHPDYLSYRLGLGNIDFQVTLDIPEDELSIVDDDLKEMPKFIKEQYQTLDKVPVTINILEHKMIGIVSGKDSQGYLDIVQTLSVQMAANNCYTDLKLVYLYNENDPRVSKKWSFARWLPHVWSEDKKTRYVASSKAEASDICYELTKIFRKREEDNTGERKIPHPYFVFFISDLSLIENELVSKYIFDSKDIYGLSVIILSDFCENLPNTCSFIIENSLSFKGIYDVTIGNSSKQEIEFDIVGNNSTEAFARRLNNIDVQETEPSGEIPQMLTFFDMYGVETPEELNVAERWGKNRTYDHISAVLGAKAGSSLCTLDVHEKYHGPHGLITGTAGSGKSETLQTFLLSLAVNYSPDDVVFCIIDYKGGGLCNLFQGLPHMVGQVTSLSSNQMWRAMVSIKSENMRRQRLFAENDVDNINDYTKLYKNGEVEDPIPHLFIVIDEFRDLKKEQPEFMRELISIAQVGRSLGVHLILSTQNPAGVIDDNIWSISKFRICLRVQNKQDSMDMLKKVDAVYISQIGRGYLQVGNDEVYEMFQTGWSGSSYIEGRTTDRTSDVCLLSLTGQEIKKKEFILPHPIDMTQLKAVRDYLIALSIQQGYNHKRTLWLPNLPNRIYLDQFEDYRKRKADAIGWKKASGEWRIDILMGLVDAPYDQKQYPLFLAYPDCGNVAVIGINGCGKSTFLQTLIYSIATCYSPTYANFYLLDFSNDLLGCFENLPHVGDIIYDKDIEKVGSFFKMLSQIIIERKLLFKGGNFYQFVKTKGTILPAILIVIDNFSAFREKTDDEYLDAMVKLSREGPSLGIYIVVSANAVGLKDLPFKIADNISTVFTLQMIDKYSYSDVLRTINIDVLPEVGIKGRGLAREGAEVIEYQTALSIESPDDYSRGEMIRKVCDDLARLWNGKGVRKIPTIPENPKWSDFIQNEDVKIQFERNDLLPVGYNYANADIYSLNLREFYCYIITGAARKGKRNYLKTIALSALQKHWNVTLIDLGNAGFAAIGNRTDITWIRDYGQLLAYCQNTLTPVFVERNRRKNSLLDKGFDETEIMDAMSTEPPIVICISSLEAFMETISKSEDGMSGYFENLFEKGSLHNIYFFGVMTSRNRGLLSVYPAFKAFTVEQFGIQFGGRLEDSILNFDYVPLKDRGKILKPGIGMISEKDGIHNVEKIVVPLVKQERTGLLSVKAD